MRLLRRLVRRTAHVVRDGRPQVVPAEAIVRGDLVELEVGDLMPADLVLSTADALSADESTLTGARSRREWWRSRSWERPPAGPGSASPRCRPASR